MEEGRSIMKPVAIIRDFFRRIAPRSKVGVLVICGIAGWFVLMVAGFLMMGQIHQSQRYLVRFENQTSAEVMVTIDGESFRPVSAGETQTIETIKESWRSGREVQVYNSSGATLYTARLFDTDLEQSDFRIVID
jgi:hypothetical protein